MKVERSTRRREVREIEIDVFSNVAEFGKFGGSGGAAKSSISVQRRREHSMSE